LRFPLQGLLAEIRAPFRSQGRAHGGLVLAFCALNGIVVANASLHDPTVGYDAVQHLKYAFTLAEGRLPSPADTAEFFSPPLPYLVPASLTSSLGWWRAAKCAQFANVLLSLGLTFLLLKLCDHLAPDDPSLKLGALLVLGLFPVYFKSFAFIRGEPYVAFFYVLAAYEALEVFSKGRNVAGLGVSLGLLILSRQWGFLILPPLLIFALVLVLRREVRPAFLVKALGSSLALAALLGGLFYARSLRNYGALTAFNRKESSRFALSNEPRSFYLGLGLDKLFTDPVRPSFANELIPIFYSEVWGDYWGYFLVYARDERNRYLSGKALEDVLAASKAPAGVDTNRHRISAYLGRVNAASLLTTVLALGGLAFGVKELVLFCLRRRSFSPERAAFSLFTLIILASLCGYLAFLVRYPELERGDTIKATYMLHVFPFVCLLASRALQGALRGRRGRAWLWLWGAVFLHNLPALITRHVR
jgi:hypothetical protein